MTKSPLYSDEFYKYQQDRSYMSAIEYAKHLHNYLSIDSIIDIGCGRGAWIKAFCHEFDIKKPTEDAMGIDGPWNYGKDLAEEFNFLPYNLDECQNLPLNRRFDLAISLELAEHLSPRSSQSLVDALCKLSDVIIFSAATRNQAGVGHINEKYPSHWASIFLSNGFAPYDLFRPALWGNINIAPWYLQNAFVYVKNGSPFAEKLICYSLKPVQNIRFMDVYHYDLFASRSSVLGMFKFLVHQYVPHWLIAKSEPVYNKVKYLIKAVK